VEEIGGTKREAEQLVEELEAEMERERAFGQPMTLDLLLMDDASQSVGPVLWSLGAGPEGLLRLTQSCLMMSRIQSNSCQSVTIIA